MTRPLLQWLSAPFGIAFIMLTGACGGDSTATKRGPSPAIVLSPASLDLAIRDSAQVVAVLTNLPSDSPHQVTWRSSDTLVAAVRPSGFVVGLRPGTAGITATVGSLHALAAVTVQAVIMSSVQGGIFTRDRGLPVAGAVVTARAFDENGCTGQETARRTYTTAADGSFAGTIPVAQPTKPGWDCVEFSVAPPAGSGLAPEAEIYRYGGDVIFPIFNWQAYFGLQPSSPPEPETGSRTWTAVSAGSAHTCALAGDGTVSCWGHNGSGQIGASVTGACWEAAGNVPAPTVPCASAPVTLALPGPFRSLSLEGTVSCVLSVDNRLSCWGDGRASAPAAVWTPEPFSVFSGSCALTDGGQPYCWFPFSALAGSVGTVAGAPSLASVSGSGSLGCGIGRDGVGWCWGFRMLGQVGDGNVDAVPPSAAVRVLGDGGFARISVGGVSCATTLAGAAYCWGPDDHGQLGAGPGDRQTCYRACVGDGCILPCSGRPLMVASDFPFAQVSAGGTHVCALTPWGEAWCWGSNAWGQLGIGAPDTLPHARPAQVTGGLRFRSITAGSRHTCAIAESGGLYCWGANEYGQLGTGSLADRARPTRVNGSAP